MANTHLFTSESVSEGHPDKVADLISDRVLDACLAQDPESRVACETLVKSRDVVLAGEITTRAEVDLDAVVRDAIRSIGYTNPADAFNADGVRITRLITHQAREIAARVASAGDDPSDQGAGDQGIMFGFACDETPDLMPLPIWLAHRLARTLADDRKSGRVSWMRPDAKTQVTVAYEGHRPVRVETVLVSTQHAPGTPAEDLESYVRGQAAQRALGQWWRDDAHLIVNPSGSFIEGGPSADAGVTGRKIIVDSYGGMARHGGGAFSGKDASKVDRSGAYFCRWAARQIVRSGLARRAEVQVAYAIGRARPVSVRVETFGAGDERAAAQLVNGLDFRPAAIVERFGLKRPIFASTANYGHFGRAELPWEQP